MENKTYDVFLSYNSEDREEVRKIAEYLRDEIKYTVWFDEWELIPGESVSSGIEHGMKASKTCAAFVGKNGKGPWQDKEIEAALRIQIQNSEKPFRVIPVLLPDALEKPVFPMLLEGNLWVDFRENDIDSNDSLWRLECGIRGIPPGSGKREHVSRGAEGQTPLIPPHFINDEKMPIPEDSLMSIRYETETNNLYCRVQIDKCKKFVSDSHSLPEAFLVLAPYPQIYSEDELL